MRAAPFRPLAGSILLCAMLSAGCREPLVEPMSRRPVLASVTAPVAYDVLDLGTLGGGHSAAYGINGAGQVVGGSQTSDGLTHAFLWERGVMTDLGTLGGPSSVAYAINPQGHVVGWSDLTNGETHATLWRDGNIVDLGTLGGSLSYAYGINAQSQVVGLSFTAPGGAVAFLWRDGVMTNIGGVKFSAGVGINVHGDVVGYSQRFTDFLRATLWRDGAATNLGLLVDIPLHFLPQSAAFGINAQRQIVGHSDIQGFGGPQHAFLWQNGAMSDLGTLGGDSSTAYAITAQGHIVGNAQLTSGVRHAVIWRGGEVIDLGEAAATVTSVARVQDRALTTDRSLARRDRQFLDLAILTAPSSDTAVRRALDKTIQNSRMAHCCRREAGDAEAGISLAELPSFATDVNERGQVVGYYYGAGTTLARAILWTPR